MISSIKRGGLPGQKAMEEIYRSYDYSYYLEKYLKDYRLSKAENTDLMHDAFLIFRDNVKKGKFDVSKDPNTYITSIAKNLAQNLKKRIQTEQIVDTNWKIYGVEESVEIYYQRKEAREKVGDLLALLTPKCSQLLKLWQLDYSYDEIAEEMGLVNREKARKDKFNCFRKLMSNIDAFPELQTLIEHE